MRVRGQGIYCQRNVQCNNDIPAAVEGLMSESGSPRNRKLQRFLMFLYELIWDECLIGFAANKHRWHTWPTSAPHIRLLHWLLLCYRTKQTNYGHSVWTIRSMWKIWFQATILLLNAVFSISLYICLDYCSPYCFSSSHLGQLPEENENVNYAESDPSFLCKSKKYLNRCKVSANCAMFAI